MFRKLVSNLPFSPSLVGQLGFYAKRLRKEEVTRRVGLVLTALALVVQSLIVFAPPESANAASSSDMVPGGIGSGQTASIKRFLDPYDKNALNLKDIMSFYGITRAEIASTKHGSWKVGTKYTWGLKSRATYAQGQRSIDITNAAGKKIRTVYAKPQALMYKRGAASTAVGWIGHSKKAGWFAIDEACGNLVLNNIPAPPVPKPKPAPKPEPPAPTPQPAATCDRLTVASLTRTSRQLQAAASTKNGATISSYTFKITDSNGKQIWSKKITTTGKTAQAKAESLPEGSHSAQVTVQTSTGAKTGTDCTAPLKIAAPDRCPVNPQLSIEDTACQTCPGNSSLWVKDEQCAAQIMRTKSTKNLELNRDATTQVAKSSQRLMFTLTAVNDGYRAADVDFTDDIEDVLEYAQIVDKGGAEFDEDRKQLSWGNLSLEPGQSIQKTFVVKMHDKIPETPIGSSEAASYDCTIVNTFGSSVSIDVDCPAPKVVENVVSELPTTGPGENMLFAAIVLTIVTYFYARSRQLKSEVRLVRRQLTTGAL